MVAVWGLHSPHYLPVPLIPSGWREQPSWVRGVYVATLIDPKWRSRGRTQDWILPSVLLSVCILWVCCQCCPWDSEEKELHSPPYLLRAWCRLLSTSPAQLFRLAQRKTGQTLALCLQEEIQVHSTCLHQCIQTHVWSANNIMSNWGCIVNIMLFTWERPSAKPCVPSQHKSTAETPQGHSTNCSVGHQDTHNVPQD